VFSVACWRQASIGIVMVPMLLRDIQGKMRERVKKASTGADEKPHAAKPPGDDLNRPDESTEIIHRDSRWRL